MRRLPAMPGSGGDDRGDRGHDSLVGGGGNEFQADEQGGPCQPQSIRQSWMGKPEVEGWRVDRFLRSSRGP